MTPSQANDPTAVIVARMEGKLDAALMKLGEHDVKLEAQDTRIRSHDTRITILEASRLKNVPTWAAVAIAALSVVVAVFAIVYR